MTQFLPLAGQGFIPREEIASYIAKVSAADRPVLDFTIELVGGQPIGACSLRDFDNADRAEISVVIGEPSAWGKGYGWEAMRLLMGYGFDRLGLHAIWLIVRAENQRAINLFRRLGFSHDGTLRAAALVDGVFHDKCLMSMLSTEWTDAL